MKEYPVLNQDIFFAKIHDNTGVQVQIRNTTTEKDFKPTPDTVALLDLCTGANTVDEIVDTLSEQSGEPAEELTEEVNIILRILQDKGIITLNNTPIQPILPAKNVTRKYPTESAQIEITNKCNLACLHCFNNSGEPCPDELTTEEILSLLDALSSMGIHKVTLTGGEPLLHPDLYTIVEHARKAPMTVVIFTNGTLLTEEHIKKFKELGVNQFAVSVDSINDTTHDTFRGKKGALKRTLHGINLLRKAGFTVRISISAAKPNKDEIIDVLEYFAEYDLTDCQVAEVNSSGRERDEVAITPEEYYQVLVRELTYKMESAHEIKPPLPKSEGGCGIAQGLIYIKADGTILPCHACHTDMGVGNIRDVDLALFWNTDETLEMLRSIRAEDDEACRNCTYLMFCDGCIANAFIVERKICCHDLYACARHKASDAVGLMK